MSALLFPSKFRTRYVKVLESMPIPKYERDIIMERYVQVVIDAEDNYRKTWALYMLLTNIITVAGVLITGLISLDKRRDISDAASTGLFWTVWGLSISLTLANKWVYAFNIHKKYVLGIVILEKLYAEGWMYVEGVGRYAKCADNTARFKAFCMRIERIKMKSLEAMPEMSSGEINDIGAQTQLPTSGHPAITVSYDDSSERDPRELPPETNPNDSPRAGPEEEASADVPHDLLARSARLARRRADLQRADLQRADLQRAATSANLAHNDNIAAVSTVTTDNIAMPGANATLTEVVVDLGAI